MPQADAIEVLRAYGLSTVVTGVPTIFISFCITMQNGLTRESLEMLTRPASRGWHGTSACHHLPRALSSTSFRPCYSTISPGGLCGFQPHPAGNGKSSVMYLMHLGPSQVPILAVSILGFFLLLRFRQVLRKGHARVEEGFSYTLSSNGWLILAHIFENIIAAAKSSNSQHF